MAKLIYKQWHRQPNLKNTPAANAAHVKYIGCREHTLKGENKTNGLFGKIGNAFSNDFNLNETMSYVNKISRKGITVLRSVISFTSKTANALELDNKERWENYCKYHISTIAKCNFIKIQDLEYVAAVHQKEDQPHIHFIFWDKNQRIGRNIVKPEIAKEIREKVEEGTFEFEDDFIEHIIEKEDFVLDETPGKFARKGIIKSTFQNELSFYARQSTEALNKISKETEKTLVVFSENVLKKRLAETFKIYKELLQTLPKEGSLKFEFVDRDYKAKILNFIERLFEYSPELKEIYNEYMDNKNLLAIAYNSEKTNCGKQEIATVLGKSDDLIKNKLANKILKSLKFCKLEIKRAAFKNSLDNRKVNQAAVNCFISVLRFLLEQNKEMERQLAECYKDLGGGELSKENIMDIIYKIQDKGRDER